MIKKQFTLYLENKPGELAKVTKELADLKINIEGISVSGSTDIGLVQVVVSDAEATEKMLSKLEIAFIVQDVALLPIKNKPGALSKIVARLASDGVNINYVYATANNCMKDCDCYAIINAPNLEKVEEAWKAG